MYEDEREKINLNLIIFIIAVICFGELVILWTIPDPVPKTTVPVIDFDQSQDDKFVSKIVPTDENGHEITPDSGNTQVDQKTKK
jgi:hypothetical protein